MKSRIHKWGNSLAIRIPKAFADEIALAPNSAVDITIMDGKLVIMPLAKPEFTLEKLLAGITDDNRHGKIENGTAVNNEGG